MNNVALPKYELALFAGAGGGILGGHLLGWRCVGAVEIERYPRNVLLARQRDGILPWFPIWDDIRTFTIDNPECREYIEWLRSIARWLVISGGFPCQNVSSAGKKDGIDGDQSRLFYEMARVVREIQPRNVFLENSSMLTHRGLGVVLGAMAEMGYDARWGVFYATDVGGLHRRPRLFITADSKRHKQPRKESCVWTPRRMGWKWKPLAKDRDWQAALSRIRGMDYGLARSVDRTDSIRNGQVPAVVKLAWETLTCE